jgi:flagella basal body P-ring formation protein FlgA
LRSVRYADDTLFGFAGPRQEAEEIKQKLRLFLREKLKLELSEEKTLITQASAQAARFLGYEILNQQNDSKHAKKRRSVNGRIGLRVPADIVRKKSAQYLKKGKPIHRAECLQDSDYSIVMRYLVAQFGGIQLIPQPQAVLRDQLPKPLNTGTEILQRLLANVCEICKSSQKVEVHHIRKLADLEVKGRKERPGWMKLMAARRRKTLVVCRSCHMKIHAGQPL